jgi:hypothetical protein
MFLALGGGECLATVFALRKRYLIAGQPVPCLEVFDWHCLPELKGTGVGIRVMRAMMRRPERVIAVGGTEDVLSALPVMGWQQFAVARAFELPTSGEFLSTGLQRRTDIPASAARLPLDLLARAWFTPRKRHASGTGRAVPISIVDSETDKLYAGDSGYDVVQQPQPEVLRWLSCGYPGNGSFRFLAFTVADRLRGWALTRVYDTEYGPEGAILELFAPQPDLDLYTWIVSEAACSLSGSAPRVIRGRATCPVLQAAFRANRFRETPVDIPVNTWPKALPEMKRVHLTLNHTDEPLRPYTQAEWLL